MSCVEWCPSFLNFFFYHLSRHTDALRPFYGSRVNHAHILFSYLLLSGFSPRPVQGTLTTAVRGAMVSLSCFLPLDLMDNRMHKLGRHSDGRKAVYSQGRFCFFSAFFFPQPFHFLPTLLFCLYLSCVLFAFLFHLSSIAKGFASTKCLCLRAEYESFPLLFILFFLCGVFSFVGDWRDGALFVARSAHKKMEGFYL